MCIIPCSQRSDHGSQTSAALAASADATWVIGMVMRDRPQLAHDSLDRTSAISRVVMTLRPVLDSSAANPNV